MCSDIKICLFLDIQTKNSSFTYKIDPMRINLGHFETHGRKKYIIGLLKMVL